MYPIAFYGANTTFAVNQAPYLPLPAHLDTSPAERVTTCWQLSWRERLKVLWTGRIWWQQLTYGQSLQPVKSMVDRPLLMEQA